MKKERNEHACALWARAGNAGTAIAVDTRPKIVGNKRRDGKSQRKAFRAQGRRFPVD